MKLEMLFKMLNYVTAECTNYSATMDAPVNQVLCNAIIHSRVRTALLLTLTQKYKTFLYVLSTFFRDTVVLSFLAFKGNKW